MLTQSQIKLTGLYNGVEAVSYQPYTQYFSEANTPVETHRKEIKIDELFNQLVKAKLFPRNATPPTFVQDGKDSIYVTPNYCGGSEPVDPMEFFGQNAVVTLEATDENSQEIQVLKRKMSIIKAGIENTKNDMASEAFLLGKVGNLSLGLSVPEDFVVDTTANEKVSVKITTLIKDYWRKYKVIPKVTVGDKVSNLLVDEVNAGGGKRNKGDYQLDQEGDKLTLKIDNIGYNIEVLPLASDLNGDDIDSDEMIILRAPRNLLWVYAGIGFKSGTSGRVFMGQVLVTETEVDNNGCYDIYGRSAPFPIIINPEMHRRYILKSSTAPSTGSTTSGTLDTQPTAPSTASTKAKKSSTL